MAHEYAARRESIAAMTTFDSKADGAIAALKAAMSGDDAGSLQSALGQLKGVMADAEQRLGKLAPGDREGARRDSVAPAFADANNNRSVAKGHSRKAAAQSVVWEMCDQGILLTGLGRFVCRDRLSGTHSARKSYYLRPMRRD